MNVWWMFALLPQGTLTLRNPSDHSASIVLNAAAVWELPPGLHAPGAEYRLESPYQTQRVRRVRLVVGRPTTLDLAPYEVLSFAGREAAKVP